MPSFVDIPPLSQEISRHAEYSAVGYVIKMAPVGFWCPNWVRGGFCL